MPTVSTQEIRTERLVLSPLRVEDAAEMAAVLADPVLYEFTGGEPPSRADLATRYTAQVAGPEDTEEIWHNWILRSLESGTAMGFVQASIVGDAADVAWVVGADWQRQGFAKEGAVGARDWLIADGVRRFDAHIHPEHIASQKVAITIGLRSTGEIDEDGEEVWRSDTELA